VRTFKETGKVPNVVNLAKKTPATCALIVRHLDRPGVLASVLDLIRRARINVQEMENVSFRRRGSGGGANSIWKRSPERLFWNKIGASNTVFWKPV